jgi:hypothetical protein
MVVSLADLGYTESMSDQWYYCLLHDRVERPGECRADDRMGPYDSPEAARRWKERHDEREEQRAAEEEASKDEWDKEDEAWEAWPDDR